MSGCCASTGRVSQWSRWVMVGVLLFGVEAMAASPRSGAKRLPSGQGVGQEMKGLEEQVKESAKPRKKKPKKVSIKAEKDKEKSAKKGKKKSSKKNSTFKITKLDVRGDKSFLTQSGLYEEIQSMTEGKKLTDENIQEIVRLANKALINGGYYLANIYAPPADYSKGVLILELDMGRVGKKTFYERSSETQIPFKGKYYSLAQLNRRLSDLEEGEIFDYPTFYSAAYDINALHDVTVDTDLKVRRVQKDGMTRRYVDMDFSVDDRLPIHGALSVANSGTEATSEWRPNLTLQHLNLTKHDDVLTLNIGPFSPNFNDLISFGASYYLPNYWKNGGAFTLFGGYSDLDAQDVVEGIDVRGEGWFTGLQQSYKLIQNDRHLLSLALGITYRVMQDQLVLTADGEEDWALEPRDVTMVPLSLAFSYSSAEPDFIGGRNFLTSQTVFHQADFLGSSSEAEIQSLRVNADGDFYIERLQLARIQPLQKEVARGSMGWLLFFKSDIQFSSGPLVPAEQKAIGGMDSVRGFPERIVQGDDGISGTLELRTPLMSTFLGSSSKTKEERVQALRENKTVDRLQFVAFVDAGYVKVKDSLSPIDSYTIAGAGAGVRMALTKYIQFRFDWGVPISGREDAETSEEEISSSGRYHLSLQAQF